MLTWLIKTRIAALEDARAFVIAAARLSPTNTDARGHGEGWRRVAVAGTRVTPMIERTPHPKAVVA